MCRMYIYLLFIRSTLFRSHDATFLSSIFVVDRTVSKYRMCSTAQTKFQFIKDKMTYFDLSFGSLNSAMQFPSYEPIHLLQNNYDYDLYHIHDCWVLQVYGLQIQQFFNRERNTRLVVSCNSCSCSCNTSTHILWSQGMSEG